MGVRRESKEAARNKLEFELIYLRHVDTIRAFVEERTCKVLKA